MPSGSFMATGETHTSKQFLCERGLSTIWLMGHKGKNGAVNSHKLLGTHHRIHPVDSPSVALVLMYGKEHVSVWFYFLSVGCVLFCFALTWE